MTTPRKFIRVQPNVKIKVEYLIFPYANFRIGPAASVDSFRIAGFDVWKDTPDQWQQFLGCSRPAKHLAMYVDRRGNELPALWLASSARGKPVGHEAWQRLTAVLFYLAWARIPFVSPDRAAAEDFYFETFAVPEGAEADSATHGRWSKFGATIWSDIKVHPSLEASLRGNVIELPSETTRRRSILYDPTLGELFRRLEQELGKAQSRFLTGLWFLHQACYRSGYQSSFEEDIQNICSALEAILDVAERGDSTKQVSERLQKLFRPMAATAVQAATSKRAKPERPEVLDRLGQWVRALYVIRNDYTHGKPVKAHRFGERSVWQDAFEIFRLAANRKILGRSEPHPSWGGALEKLLMSVCYFDEAVAFFSKKNERWLAVGRKKAQDIRRLKDVIRKARTLDPQFVESVANIKVIRQALFNICIKICRTLERTDAKKLSSESQAMLLHLQGAYASSRDALGKLDIDAYIRKVAPRLTFWVPGTPMEGRSIALYELVEAFKNLAAVYGNFTAPIARSMAATLPSPAATDSSSTQPETAAPQGSKL